jgi:four helix bundle protein
VSAELEYLLLLCRDLGYLPPAEYEGLVQSVVEVRKLISGLVRKL